MGKKYEVRCGDWRTIIKVERGPLSPWYIVDEISETATFNCRYHVVILVNELGNTDIGKIDCYPTEEILDCTDLKIDTNWEEEEEDYYVRFVRR